MPVIAIGAMPVIALGSLTILVLAIAVWASVTQDSDPTMIGEGEPDWGSGSFDEQQGYRTAGCLPGSRSAPERHAVAASVPSMSQ